MVQNIEILKDLVDIRVKEELQRAEVFDHFKPHFDLLLSLVALEKLHLGAWENAVRTKLLRELPGKENKQTRREMLNLVKNLKIGFLGVSGVHGKKTDTDHHVRTIETGARNKERGESY